RDSYTLDAWAVFPALSRTPRTDYPRPDPGLARARQKRRTPRVAAPGVHVPRRRRLQLRWVAPRSLAKTGLRRKGDVRPKIFAGARFRIPGPTAARTGASPPSRCIPGAMSAGRGLGAEIPGHPREDAAGKGVRTAKVAEGSREAMTLSQGGVEWALRATHEATRSWSSPERATCRSP